MDYQLEIKQVVDYPRCRIYREFIQTLLKDRNIRTNGDSCLFYFLTLCSYANFRSSYQRLEGISYLLGPGEWICRTSELSGWFRTRFHHQAISILDYLQKQNYITYTRLGRGNLIKYQIINWKASNTSLEYNYPCLKDTGFFFFPIFAVHELISMGKCSEMDILLDLWVHAIYNDTNVQGSDVGPVVYFRNNTGNPLVNYRDLAERWGTSKTTVCRLIKKLEENQYLTLVSFTGRHGSVIYLQNYLSTMFSISDVMIDKEEVSMTFEIPVSIPDEIVPYSIPLINEEQICVPNDENSVPKSHIQIIVQKLAEILSTQGIVCCECPHTQYKLFRLSAWREDIFRYSLRICCEGKLQEYQFELTLQALPAKKPYGNATSHETKSRKESIENE